MLGVSCTGRLAFASDLGLQLSSGFGFWVLVFPGLDFLFEFICFELELGRF